MDTDEDADEQIGKDFKASVNTSPGNGGVLFVCFSATLPVLYVVFDRFNDNYPGMFWLIRWIAAAAVATLSWSIFVTLLSAINQVPVKPDFASAERRHEDDAADTLSPEDQNDIHIIRQVASLESLSRRIETYTLESALLSALSFSSFLSIILSDRDYLGTLRTLLPPPLVWQKLPAPLAGLPLVGSSLPMLAPDYVAANVMGLICFSLLLCAATFLAVLVARLRFNDGYRDAESLLHAAERLNEKEDRAIERDQPAQVRIYSDAIQTMLSKSEELERRLGFTVAQMRLSRNAGILFFIAALALCGMFFNETTAELLTGFFVIAFAIGYADRVTHTLMRNRILGGGGLAGLLGGAKLAHKRARERRRG